MNTPDAGAGVDTDFTQSRETIDALSLTLRESEERYRTLFDLVPVAVYAIDRDGVIQNFNRRAAELWGREPALGDTDERFCGSYKLFRPDGTFMPHPECPMAQVVTGVLVEVRDAEVIIERPDGSRITVVVNIRPQRNQSGEVIGAINCFYDITERKRHEEALRQSDRNKTEFLAMLAHELRNPLAPILVSVEILRRAHRIDERADAAATASVVPVAAVNHRSRDALNVLTRQVAHVVRLVDDLLDAARIGRGKMELRREHVDVSAVVRNAVDAVRPLCEELQHELTVTLPSQPVVVYADPARLAQVVGNLLNNACKFTERGGHIWLTVDRVARSQGDRTDEELMGLAPEIAIRVRDQGIGIAPDEMVRVFNMFEQADTSLERSRTGLGIGLSLVKTLTLMHGGSVEASSAGVGQGSEFIVRLPIATETTSLPSQPPTTEPAVVPPLRILIVDDNRDSADMLATLLTFSGHETYTANDGLTAVDRAAHLQPDVIFMDIGLPGLNGYEAAERIRAAQSDKRPVLVALTGWGQEADRRRSEDAGFDAHLVKPVDDSVIGKLLVNCARRDARVG
jgi:signal transduction histidine kinase/ActR/RegA family two-component response regulator